MGRAIAHYVGGRGRSSARHGFSVTGLRFLEGHTPVPAGTRWDTRGSCRVPVCSTSVKGGLCSAKLKARGPAGPSAGNFWGDSESRAPRVVPALSAEAARAESEMGLRTFPNVVLSSRRDFCYGAMLLQSTQSSKKSEQAGKTSRTVSACLSFVSEV